MVIIAWQYPNILKHGKPYYKDYIIAAIIHIYNGNVMLWKRLLSDAGMYNPGKRSTMSKLS